MRGFAAAHRQSEVLGFDVDLCAAVAAAILGEHARPILLQAQNIRSFRDSSAIDMVSRRLTATAERERAYGVRFAPVVLRDGQGFMVDARSENTRLEHLSGVRICVRTGTLAERHLIRAFSERQLALHIVQVPDARSALNALFEGECTAWSADVSELASTRAGAAGRMPDRDPPAGLRILAEDMISEEPIAPLVRAEDVRLWEIVRAVIEVLIAAEACGLRAADARAVTGNAAERLRERLGLATGISEKLGLHPRWVRDVLATVGNYAEVFERNLGVGTGMELDRKVHGVRAIEFPAAAP